MSETDQEKTEQPSERRIKKSRDEGQIPRSRELTSALIMLSASLLLKISAEPAGNIIKRIMTLNLQLERSAVFDTNLMTSQLANSFFMIIPLAVMVLGGIMLMSIVGQTLVGGWIFNPDNMMPKLNRMSPKQWVGKVFSKKGVVELIKSILKILLVIGCLIWLLIHNYPLLLGISRMSFNTGLATGLSVISKALFAYAAVLVFISAIDAPFQIWDHNQKLKMTLQEVKDEHKDTEGRPEIKQKIRQIQRETANQRMMQKVPEADVVIINPTHYSVALKYDKSRASAPFVIAKGTDETALRIRETGRNHEIPVVETPMLTRAIYYSTRIDQEIPADLYLAVAQVLAYIFQLDQFRQGKTDKPPVMATPDIPEEYLKHSNAL